MMSPVKITYPRIKERDIQIHFLLWISYQYPALFKDTYHFANERKCSAQQGALLKRMGVKRGVADIFCSVPLNGYGGLWIEIKSGSNKATVEQKSFLTRQKENGFACAIATGFDECKQVFDEYVMGRNKDFFEAQKF